jgi:hypothetical protein
MRISKADGSQTIDLQRDALLAAPAAARRGAPCFGREGLAAPSHVNARQPGQRRPDELSSPQNVLTGFFARFCQPNLHSP